MAVFLILLVVPMVLDLVVGIQGSELVGSVWSGGVGGWIFLFTVASAVRSCPIIMEPRDPVSF